MENYADQAINAVYGGKMSFCKFLSANDTGLTGGHQAGIYISKPAVPILFDERFERGNKKRISYFPRKKLIMIYILALIS